ncbi:DUF2541 family protein [Saprospiraceae bacterium]|nr:DUF2541 family protein [Saprospiraceae bacterium]
MMLQRKIQIFAAVLAFAFLSISAQVLPIQSLGDWTVLGERTVNMQADHDEILVTAREGKFQKLKFKLLKAPIFIHNIKVVYANGTSENHVINKKFKKGDTSRVLDLEGNKRIIRKIIFNYKTIKTNKGRAHIVVLGKH